ncbi:hypothetical protein FDG50_00390 [Clostridium botulinum]|uniref:hypothetical protein n=1 Tax=Clostridium botulinum TaxID=1491 RepID=UPI0013FF3361|nr:hypothetical protein [Clostridium botulinum]MBY6835986.1 hypothetical protein [Clostridium botulinum]MBY6929795.1 hypothetical protein [Clostridium botulinum]NFG65770.1 hypothetical protein [Clostridium botulinum]NFQ22606.1 hypothetical protein [Clostridium botulinum]
MDSLEFEIWDKQTYIKYLKDLDINNIKKINEHWDNMRKGYNFIIVDKHDNNQHYSVEFFNEMFL